VKHSLLPRDRRKTPQNKTGFHTGVNTHRQDARQFATVRARLLCHERRALRDKVLACKEGATRHPLRCPSSLRRHQDAAWTTHGAQRQRSMRWWYVFGASVDVCRWPKHPAYGTANKLQRCVSMLHTSAHTKTNNTPPLGDTAVEDNLACAHEWDTEQSSAVLSETRMGHQHTRTGH